MSSSARQVLALGVVLVAVGCGGPSGPTSVGPSPGDFVPASPVASGVPGPTASVDEGLGPEVIVSGRLARPAQPAMSASFRSALVADHCTDRDLPAPPTADLALVVLDRSYALPSDYAPGDLVPASTAGLTGASGTKLVSRRIVEDLAAMSAAWRAAGLQVIVESAYRSYGNQAATFNSWVARLGYSAALARSARPGHSEHQLGTALDLTSPGWGGRFGDWAADSAEGAWMAAHGWEYGFVMSYPAGSQALTCFSYEPWHYRWIGREAAAAQRASGLHPRQFLERFVGG
ncbi:MAG: D-alanyl-D-alanine carboxypeptidase family protein [Chloroflexi bacterium]|nr:D-alanyl-D-alanine carboxypeptidase family protein [Chloroflexota bacterium]